MSRIFTNHSKIFYLLTGLILLSVFSYLPALNGDFYHDDRPNLLENKSVQIEKLNAETLANAAFSSHAGKLKRPISMTSFALNYYFFGNQPFSFKVVNVAIHIIIGCLIFYFSYLIKKQVSATGREKESLIFALIVTSLWLLHPLHVSTVAYIVQRMAMLSAMFSILAVIFYIIGRSKLAIYNYHGIWFFAGSAASIILALLSKENGILTIPLIILTECIIFRFQPSNCTPIKVVKFAFLIGIVFTLAIVAYYFSHLKEFILRGYSSREFTLEERLYTQIRALILYIKWLVAPNIQELGLFHDDIPISKSFTQPISTLISAATLVVALITSFFVRKRYPIFIFGLSWYLCAHALESSIISLEMIYEHRNYLPSIGIIFIFAELITIILNTTNKKTILAITFAIPALLSFTTILRTNQWSDVVNFSYYEALHHPNSYRAVYSLGRVYANLVLSGDISFKDDAFKYLEKARELDKTGILPETVLIMLAHKTNERVKQTWYSSIIKKLENFKLSVSDLDSLKSLTDCPEGKCLLSTTESSNIFTAVFNNPYTNTNNRRRSDLLTIFATYQTNRLRNFEKAEILMKEAIDISPSVSQYYINYINLLLYLQRTNEASEYLARLKNMDKLNSDSIKIEALENELQLINQNIERERYAN